MLKQGKITMKTVKVTEGTGVSEKAHTVSVGERKEESLFLRISVGEMW